jgi:hypothetical protein
MGMILPFVTDTGCGPLAAVSRLVLCQMSGRRAASVPVLMSNTRGLCQFAKQRWPVGHTCNGGAKHCGAWAGPWRSHAHANFY